MRKTMRLVLVLAAGILVRSDAQNLVPPPQLQCPQGKINGITACYVWHDEMFVPNASCPIFLSKKDHTAGLGHAFHDFIRTVGQAASTRVTLHMAFGTSPSHGNDKTLATTYFFGNRFNGNEAAIGACRVVPFNPTDGHLITQVNALRVDCAKAGAGASPPCTVIHMGKDGLSEKNENMGGGLNYYMFRKIFADNAPERAKLLQSFDECRGCDHRVGLPPGKAFLTPPDEVHIAVHIRRGDLEHYYKVNDPHGFHQLQTRLVPAITTLKLLVALLRDLLPAAPAGPERHVIVSIHCEGMSRERDFLVPEVDGSQTDFAAGLREFGSRVELQYGATNALVAFTELCYADVLVGGLSGFTGIVSALCPTPIILAPPWGYFGSESIYREGNAVSLDVAAMANFSVRLDWSSAHPTSASTVMSLPAELRYDKTSFWRIWRLKLDARG